MQLGNGLPGQIVGVERQLLAQHAQIVGRPLAMTRDDFVARTEIAQRSAKRDVHVQRKRLPGAAGSLGLLTCMQRLQQVAAAKSRRETVCRGIGRVAWPRDVVADQQFGRNGRGG